MYRLFVVFILVLLVPTLSYAQTTFKTKSMQVCGGEILMNDDCSSNPHRRWHVSCCDEGYRIQGIRYTDHTGDDKADTVAPVCRSVVKGNKNVENRDFGPEKKSDKVCHNTEILSGLYWKDFVYSDGRKSDSMDGVTPICLNPTTGQYRTIPNTDISMQGGAITKVTLAQEVVGIAEKERLADTTDCVALVVRPRKPAK